MISIIVPIYNVEKYLARCLDSLAELEPVDGGIEVILVDDGSTDNSGPIADEYAERYGGFTVYHTENHGLSAARNFGIERSHGDRIMFLDSDDRADPLFCRTPLAASAEYDADIVIFNYYFESKKGNKIRRNENTNRGIVSHETAMEIGEHIVWNKLYKRELFDDIRFPEGHVFEDVATTHKLIYKADKIAVISDALLYYNSFRSGSITHVVTKEYVVDRFDACMGCYDFLSKNGYPMEKYSSNYNIVAFAYCVHMEPSDDERYLKAERIIDELDHFPRSFTNKMKIMLVVWKINKDLFHSMCKVLGRKVS